MPKRSRSRGFNDSLIVTFKGKVVGSLRLEKVANKEDGLTDANGDTWIATCEQKLSAPGPNSPKVFEFQDEGGVFIHVGNLIVSNRILPVSLLPIRAKGISSIEINELEAIISGPSKSKLVGDAVEQTALYAADFTEPVKMSFEEFDKLSRPDYNPY